MTPLIVVAAVAVFAVALAAAGALGLAYAAPADSPVRHGRAMAHDFRARLVVAFPMATVGVLLIWFTEGRQ